MHEVPCDVVLGVGFVIAIRNIVHVRYYKYELASTKKSRFQLKECSGFDVFAIRIESCSAFHFVCPAGLVLKGKINQIRADMVRSDESHKKPNNICFTKKKKKHQPCEVNARAIAVQHVNFNSRFQPWPPNVEI